MLYSMRMASASSTGWRFDPQCCMARSVGRLKGDMFNRVEMSVRGADGGVMAAVEKKGKIRKDVKIARPSPPSENHKQKMILVLGSRSRARDTMPSAPPLPQHFSSALAPLGKIRDLEKARDRLKIRNLKNELTAGRSELKQSRAVISNSKKALLDSALSQLDAYKKLESLTQVIM
ncbi:hypothetical protein VPH35_084910 [Triticum aestivum]